MAHDYSRITDELLVLRAQAGEEASFAALHKRWSPALLRHARRLTGDAHAADDTAQEAWLAIARGIRRLDDPARFPAWAYRILHNKCADWVSRRSRERCVFARDADDREAAGAEADPAHAVAAQDDVARLQTALNAMPRRQRAVLALLYLEGLSVAEIAQVESIPAGTVKSRLHHARLTLRAALKQASQPAAEKTRNR